MSSELRQRRSLLEAPGRSQVRFFMGEMMREQRDKEMMRGEVG